jgi:hypothetical protein
MGLGRREQIPADPGKVPAEPFDQGGGGDDPRLDPPFLDELPRHPYRLLIDDGGNPVRLGAVVQFATPHRGRHNPEKLVR